jgi:hypothetical protein
MVWIETLLYSAALINLLPNFLQPYVTQFIT